MFYFYDKLTCKKHGEWKLGWVQPKGKILVYSAIINQIKSMSIFERIGNVFGSDVTGKNAISWEGITDEQQVEDIISASKQKPQVIYKHSPRCGTSFMALRSLESISPEVQNRANFYMVDVISQRSLSFHIAEKLGIRHESPQLFVIKDGQVVWHGSHYQVNAETVSSTV